VLGRTNRVFPGVWLSLALPRDGHDVDGLVRAALDSNAPIDISSQPALWGGKMRGTDATLVAIGNRDFENATDEGHACSLTQAHLIEILSSIGREIIDIYYFRVRQMAEEFQISGALQALDMAKQEGHIGHIGICCDGPAFGTLGAWQFHDAFETLLVPRNHFDSEAYEVLSPLANERRVGIVTSRPLNWGDGTSFTDAPEHWRLRNLTQSFYGQTLAQAVIADLANDHPVLVGVRTSMEVEQAVSCVDKKQPEGLKAMLQPFIDSFNQAAEPR
jgi:aryl-alcohol dehydrogenase-like predicted oxidoreductase